jgi:hypothetical protein
VFEGNSRFCGHVFQLRNRPALAFCGFRSGRWRGRLRMTSLGMGSGGSQRHERHSFRETLAALMERWTKTHEPCMAEEFSERFVLITMSLHGNSLNPRMVAQRR